MIDGLAKVFDTANVQFMRFSELNQLVAAGDIAAVQPSVRDMPGMVLYAMQSNGESLISEFRQSCVEFCCY